MHDVHTDSNFARKRGPGRCYQRLDFQFEVHCMHDVLEDKDDDKGNPGKDIARIFCTQDGR
eukprot:6247900-Amphidinium_carterae.1